MLALDSRLHNKEKSRVWTQPINSHQKKLLLLFALALVGAILYMTVFVDFDYPAYALKTRFPKLVVMLIASFCIGGASIAFQTIINNTIVTPCLLGLNALFILVQTVVLFVFGVNSVFVTNRVLSYGVNLIVMIFASMMIYGYLFKKTRSSVLYILLIGTMMATFFSSISTALQRLIDPSDFLVLQNKMTTAFNRTTTDSLVFSVFVVAVTIYALRKEIQVLDVIALGKDQAINLGVDYDKTINRLMIGITVFISVATALVGPISFLGLIIANLARNYFKTYRHSYLILGSMAFGVIMLVFSQGLVEHVFNFSTQVSVFINVGGGLYFLYLILKERTA